MRSVRIGRTQFEQALSYGRSGRTKKASLVPRFCSLMADTDRPHAGLLAWQHALRIVLFQSLHHGGMAAISFCGVREV